MDPNQEITIHLEKFERMQSNIDDQRYQIRRKINELERVDIDLVVHPNKFESFVTPCEQTLEGHGKYSQLGLNREITIYLKKFERVHPDLCDQRREIQREIDQLKRADDYLADCFYKFEGIIDKCQRALAGDSSILIGDELQRFGWELEDMRQQIPSLNLAELQWFERELEKMRQQIPSLNPTTLQWFDF